MRILMVGPIHTSGGVSTHMKELIKGLNKRGIDIDIFNIYSAKGFLIIPAFMIKLYKRTIHLIIFLLLNGKNFDLVHIQSSGPIGGFLPSIITTFVLSGKKVKLLHTFHYSGTEKFVKKWKYLFKYVFDRSNGFIVVSEKQKKVILEVISNKGMIWVIPNGYNSEKFIKILKKDVRKSLGINLNDKVLINVALLFKKKGQKYLIDAVKILRDEYGIKNLKCIIIGEGPLRKRLERYIKKRKISNEVSILGYIPFDDLVKYLNSADLFVLPSLDEGNPIVMFESLGLGIPFIGTNVGGIPEIIKSEEYGFLTDPGDEKMLAKILEKAIEKKWDKEKIINYSLQYTWDEVINTTIKVYDDLIYLKGN